MIMILNFLSPIFYPESIIPARFITVYHMNPLYQYLFFMRTITIGGISPTPVTYLYCALAMALQAILELPGMWGYNWLETKFKTSSLLIFSIAMYAVKGFMFCIASSIPMIYVAYAFQAVSFAIFTPAGISYANKFFGEGDKNKAIGLFSLIGSIAGIIAAPVSGWAIDGFGVHMMLVIVTVMAGVGVIFAFLGLEREKAQA